MLRRSLWGVVPARAAVGFRAPGGPGAAAPGTGGTAPPLNPHPEEENRRRRSFTERPAGRSSPTTVGNLCGLPAVAIPCGFSSKEGLPIGLQFMGPALGETAVLAAAAPSASSIA